MILLKSLCLIFLFLSISEGAAAKEFNDKTGVISVISVDSCATCSGGLKFNLRVGEANNSSSFNITLDNDITKLSEARLINGLYLLIGDLPYGGNVIFIVDSLSKSVVNKFYAYDLIFSPTNQYAIFKQFYPRSSSKESQKTILRLISFDKSEAFNKNISPEVAGVAIYPKSIIGKNQATTVEGGENVNLNNNLIWSGDWYAFVSAESGMHQLFLGSIKNIGKSCALSFLPIRMGADNAPFVLKNTEFVNGILNVNFFEQGGIGVQFNFKVGLLCGGLIH